MGGFVILDGDGKEIIRAGGYYRTGLTNDETESFALRDALDCLAFLSQTRVTLSGSSVWGQLTYDALYDAAFKKSELPLYILGFGIDEIDRADIGGGNRLQAYHKRGKYDAR